MNRRESRVDPILLARARAMRQEPAPAEQKLWSSLRSRSLGGFKFRRQYSVGQYIADFYCADANLIIELDGESHEDRLAYDAQRTAELERRGLKVIRFVNTDVFENMDEVLSAILQECEQRANRPLT